MNEKEESLSGYQMNGDNSCIFKQNVLSLNNYFIFIW